MWSETRSQINTFWLCLVTDAPNCAPHVNAEVDQWARLLRRRCPNRITALMRHQHRQRWFMQDHATDASHQRLVKA